MALLSTVTQAQSQPSDPVAKAISQGDVFQSKRKYELALDSYRKADKLAHHSSAAVYIKLAAVEIKMGDFPSALDDSKKAVKAAGDNKALVVEAHLLRSTLLTQMSGKPSDKKLREAEDELRQAMALDPAQPITHYNLGMVLLKQERDADGLAEMNTFVAAPAADPATVAEARRIIASPIRAREPFAPDFNFTTLEKENISNASLRGKVILLDFWGTWCPPCRESVPILRSLNKKYSGKQFQLVGVSSDEDEDVWRTYIEAQHMNWSEYLDLSGDVQLAFKIESFPTYIVLDKDGVVRYRQSGLGDSTQGDIEDAINKALKRNSDPALLAAASVPASAPAGSTGDGSASAATRNSDRSAANPQQPQPAPGFLYRNDDLGFSFEFPQGWIAAKSESLAAVNERNEAAAKAALLQQHPEAASGNMRFSGSKIIFYASRKGEGDGQHMSVPSMRITAAPSRLDTLNANRFRDMTERMAAASDMKIIAPALEFLVKDHQFLRVDFERGAGRSRMYQSQIQTLAGDSLLTIDIFATSTDELQKIASTMQTMTIKDDDR
ncbi:MAG TPA: redoxin family protein [Candidatus Angelobacter sp.]|nr:redoxin family protein [Candidatus Angelobacter sp.]